MTGLGHALYVMFEHVVPYLTSVFLDPNAVQNRGVNMGG